MISEGGLHEWDNNVSIESRNVAVTDDYTVLHMLCIFFIPFDTLVSCCMNGKSKWCQVDDLNSVSKSCRGLRVCMAGWGLFCSKYHKSGLRPQV